MSARVEVRGPEGYSDPSTAVQWPLTERIIEPLFSSTHAEFLPQLKRHITHIQNFLESPTTMTAVFALDSCREISTGMKAMNAPTLKSGRAATLRAMTLAILSVAESLEPTPECLPLIGRMLSGSERSSDKHIDPAILAGVSEFNSFLRLEHLKLLASHGGACDTCAASFMSLVDAVRAAPVKMGFVSPARTVQAEAVARLSDATIKILPDAEAVISHCAPRPALVEGFREHVERVQLILAAGKLGELSKLFGLLAGDMVEAKYTIQKQIVAEDASYKIDDRFAAPRAGRRHRTLLQG